MNTSNVEHEFTFHIEPFGQQRGLWNLYTQLTFCYTLSNTAARSTIPETLKRGLERLTASFQWASGQVFDDSKDIVPFYVVRPYQTVPTLVIKDLSSDLPSFQKYQQSNFPIEYLDENLIAPRKTKSISADTDPKPVFLLQVIFIDGGVLLTFAAQHGVMDVVGMAETIRLLSKACHNTPFTHEEILLGNRDRSSIVPLLSESEMHKLNNSRNTNGEAEPLPSDVQQKAEKPITTTETSPLVRNVWTNFHFSSQSLKALKAFATATKLSTSDFISTDDSLSAFIWKRIVYARSPRYTSLVTSTFARTVDVRRFLDIPSIYPGNLVNKTSTTYSFDELLELPLGAIAEQLRHSITADLGYQSRVIATNMTRAGQKHEPAVKRDRDLSKDIAFSSWSKVDYCWDLDFNLGLGKPKAVRRPAFAPPNEQPMEGLVYLLPKQPDGDITAVICLRQDDMDRLCADDEWIKFARYVG